MTVRALAAVMSATLIAACFVDRPSHTFECQTTADCARFDDNRQCRGGYCIVPNCPADCTECDEDARTCLVECSTGDSCGNVTCPSGWDCTINCIGTNACNDVDCLAGSKCTVTCAGSGACDAVDCRAACRCDLTCAAGACDTPVCPTVGMGANQVRCTSDGTSAGTCDSSRASGCTKC
jgi:hypothetical protein